MNFIKNIGTAISSTSLERPPCEVVKTEKDVQVEERNYAKTKWVSTQIKGISQENARSEGFNKLFKYITGANEKSTKIDMTVPVATKIEPGPGANCENTFTVSFYVPPKHQDDPPKPTNPDVFIEEFPAMKVLVTSFGGFAKEDTWLSEAQKLTEWSQKNNVKCRQDMWFTAGYNSPFQLFGRTNEIWLVKDEKE